MSLLTVRFQSKFLERNVSFKIIIPNDLYKEELSEFSKEYSRPTKSLYLLHGFGGDNLDWITKTNIIDLAIKYNLAIIFPSGENSYYVNKEGLSNQFSSFIGEELVNYVQNTFNLSSKKENTFIGGLSMGGFGAIRISLAFPQTFSKAFGLSSAMLIEDISSKDIKNKTHDIGYYENTFGPLSKVKETFNNPEILIRKNIKDNISNPKFFMVCGTEDQLLQDNRNFQKTLAKYSYDVLYKESEGNHNWIFWNKWLEPSLRWLVDEQ